MCPPILPRTVRLCIRHEAIVSSQSMIPICDSVWQITFPLLQIWEPLNSLLDGTFAHDIYKHHHSRIVHEISKDASITISYRGTQGRTIKRGYKSLFAIDQVTLSCAVWYCSNLLIYQWLPGIVSNTFISRISVLLEYLILFFSDQDMHDGWYHMI